MRRFISVSAFLLATLSSLAGCASPGTRYIETGGSESVVSVGEVDIQDLMGAASGMLQSLASSGVLRRAANQPAVIVFDKVTNDTSSHFARDELLYRIREELVNTGQAVAHTTYGERAEDPTAQAKARERAFYEDSDTGTGGSELQPDFSLRGRVTELKRRSGDTRQTTYTFRLTLTDMNRGVEAWTKTSSVTKQGEKANVGW